MDRRVVHRAVELIAPRRGDLVVDIGAGGGALTIPLARAGASVVAVERDPMMAAALRNAVRRAGVDDRVRIVRRDVRRFRWPDEPYRVVGNLPFGLTTAILELLLDDPVTGPEQAEVLVQVDVARNRADAPPTSLRSAAWAPWWTVGMGDRIPRTAFRPVSAVDGAWLHIRRRRPSVLPEWLAPDFREVLRPQWRQHHG